MVSKIVPKQSYFSPLIETLKNFDHTVVRKEANAKAPIKLILFD